MPEVSFNLKIVLILAVGFAFASFFGYLTHRLKISPILGYLIAGFLIGPFSPGFVADLAVAEQLAEIGIVLMLFAVGLHFKIEDLSKVKYVAIPGAIAQTGISAAVVTIILYNLGWSIESGIIFGCAIGVASTVVLLRVLSYYHLLNTPEGHMAVGWLIVEDIITVFILILLPTLADSFYGESVSFRSVVASLIKALFKFIFLAAILFTLGHKLVVYIFSKVSKTHSEELFTLTILALTFVIAIGSTLIFGTSIALGAFLAGMVIGKTKRRFRVSASVMPLKDVFSVVFFLSVGMLFNPIDIKDHFVLFLGILLVILVLKPLVALIIVKILKKSFGSALMIALALAQIGEFSFILAEQATNLNLLPDKGYDIIVASALVTIAINPLLFKFLPIQTLREKKS